MEGGEMSKTQKHGKYSMTNLFITSMTDRAKNGEGLAQIAPFLCKSQLRPTSVFFLIQLLLVVWPLLAGPHENTPTNPSGFMCSSMVWAFWVLSSYPCLCMDPAASLWCSDSFSPSLEDLCPSQLCPEPLDMHVWKKAWLLGSCIMSYHALDVIIHYIMPEWTFLWFIIYKASTINHFFSTMYIDSNQRMD